MKFPFMICIFNGDTFRIGRYEQYMKKQITKKIWRCPQRRKIWLYKNSSAFLFPSEGEGFGLPAIETMQFVQGFYS